MAEFIVYLGLLGILFIAGIALFFLMGLLRIQPPYSVYIYYGFAALSTFLIVWIVNQM
jgi:fumarate reductase subunit D